MGEEPAWDSAVESLLVGSDPSWNSPERPSNDVEEIPASQDICGLGYLEYCENIQEEGGAFYQIGSDLFVVNGWDPNKKVSKPSWFHVQRSTIGDVDVGVCQCPLSPPDGECVHQQFLCENGEELFPLDTTFANRDADVVLFSRQELQEGLFLNHFSSPSPNLRSLSGRVIVTYTGDDSGSGQWLCTKDSSTGGCSHLSRYRDLLQKLVRVDPTATDDSVGDGCSIDYAVPRVRRAALERKPVSYLQIFPPPWASLATDPTLYERPPALENTPDRLRLTPSSTCCCSEPRRRYIGPDGRDLGIFNYNNRKLFMHDLLDEYTSAYTSSETPFSAWVTVLNRRYELHSGRSEHPFVTAEVFRAVWFSFVGLQYLDGSMMCPQCSPSPENTIWDGVTLAFNRKHLLPSLEPPTVSQPDSTERSTTRYLPGQQLVANRKLRRLVRCMITGPPLTAARISATVAPRVGTENGRDRDADDEDEDDEEEEDEVEERAVAKTQREMLERLNAIPGAVAGLSHVCPGLGALFESKFGGMSVMQGKGAADVYRCFFFQLKSQ
ncbi:hypothetical protein B0H14DRAFT_2617083 [Mycena olivaceomarginata]|nr:hypothetical protein B0H14DRAFT_2617083 [Mycena olivaceomarginata]